MNETTGSIVAGEKDLKLGRFPRNDLDEVKKGRTFKCLILTIILYSSYVS